MNDINELDLIWEINQTISCNTSTKDITSGLKTVLLNFLNITDFKIVYFNRNQNIFQNFEDETDITNTHTIKNYNEVFDKLKSTIRMSFILNNSFFVINDDFYMEYKLKLQKGENIFYLPLMQNYQCIGFIKLTQNYNTNDYIYKNIIKLLFILSSQVAGMLTNKKLNTKITKIANFYKAQKNIAKMLETQYDYSFLIPIIGEILDNYTNEYFSYIFMKNKNNEFTLAWPLRYNKKRIDPILNNIPDKNVILKQDKENIILFPIHFENQLKGIIIIDGKNKKISQEDIDLFMQLSIQIATTLNKAGTYAETEKFATKDTLTNLNNRRSLDLKINQEIAVAKRKNLPLCVMMLDIDHFKKINDTYGHYVGDIILKDFAKIINDEIREYDFPARYGGEEFFIILPSTTIKEAQLVANRLRLRIEKEFFDISKADIEQKSLKITISIGLSQFTKTEDSKSLYLKVDKALYTAKETGRNKVITL